MKENKQMSCQNPNYEKNKIKTLQRYEQYYQKNRLIIIQKQKERYKEKVGKRHIDIFVVMM
jgi:hypothetical protein